MTREQILRQIATLQLQLDEMDKTQGFVYGNMSLTEAENEKQHQEDLQRIRGLRLIDDDFMNVCFDGYIDGAERKRARYHSSILDAHLFQPGEDFNKLPETFVIFIMENDVLGDGLSLYTVDRQITNTGKPFDDGEHIVYVNGADKDASTALGKLMHDFFCTDPDDMHYKELADKVRYFKEDEKGVATMCKVMEDMRNESAERRSVEIAKNLLQLGKLTFEEIASSAGLTIERVKELAMPKTAQ